MLAAKVRLCGGILKNRPPVFELSWQTAPKWRRSYVKSSATSCDLWVTCRAASADPSGRRSTCQVSKSEIYLESRPFKGLNISNKILIKINWKSDREPVQAGQHRADVFRPPSQRQHFIWTGDTGENLVWCQRQWYTNIKPGVKESM